MDTARLQEKRVTKEYLEKECEVRNANGGLQVQLEKDGSSSTRHDWMKTSGLRTMIHWELHGVI